MRFSFFQRHFFAWEQNTHWYVRSYVHREVQKIVTSEWDWKFKNEIEKSGKSLKASTTERRRLHYFYGYSLSVSQCVWFLFFTTKEPTIEWATLTKANSKLNRCQSSLTFMAKIREKTIIYLHEESQDLIKQQATINCR